jgi:vancomycin resistance protein VanW
MKLRRLIPAPLRLHIRLLQRHVQDWREGNLSFFATKQAKNDEFSFVISLSQPIMPTSFYENKIHNIEQGCQRIENVVIAPNQILSFWKCVKKPSKNNKFRIGRNLINGKLAEDYGGGLCQLSSIMYHLALLADLDIVERHHHSFDIYQEHERFTPLGADATVVYAYKDLRLKNPYDFPIYFAFHIKENTLTCSLHSAAKIEAKDIIFTLKTLHNGLQIETTTSIANETILLASSFYQKK